MTAHEITTFDSALRYLAQEERDKFNLWRPEPSGELYFVLRQRIRRQDIDVDEFTQDDIDEVLALIGWEYEVRRHDETGWVGIAMQNGTVGEPQDDGDWLHPDPDKVYATKIEASRGALIAAVRTWAESRENK